MEFNVDVANQNQAGLTG